MRGVNLGSWLVLEKWMSPKPWDGIDGDPWGERQLMLAAKRQGKTAQVRPRSCRDHIHHHLVLVFVIHLCLLTPAKPLLIHSILNWHLPFAA